MKGKARRINDQEDTKMKEHEENEIDVKNGIGLSDKETAEEFSKYLKFTKNPELFKLQFNQENTDDPNFRFDPEKMSPDDLDQAEEVFDDMFGKYGFYDMQKKGSMKKRHTDKDQAIIANMCQIEVFPNGRDKKSSFTSPDFVLEQKVYQPEMVVKGFKALTLWSMTNRSVKIFPLDKDGKSLPPIIVPKLSPRGMEKEADNSNGINDISTDSNLNNINNMSIDQPKAKADSGKLFDNPLPDQPKVNEPMTKEELHAAAVRYELMMRWRKDQAGSLRADLTTLRSLHEKIDPKNPLSPKEESKASHYYKKSAPESYKRMVKALYQSIKALEDETKTPAQIEMALNKYKQSADLLLFETKLFAFPNHNEAKKAIARKAIQKHDNRIEDFRGLNYAMVDPKLPAGGYGSSAEIKNALNEKAALLGEKEAPSRANGKVRPADFYGPENMKVMNRRLAMEDFLKQLRKTSRLKFKVGPGALKPDEFLPKLNRPNGYECALNFMTKDYLAKALSPDATPHMLEEMIANLKNSTFLKAVDKLATDPVFKEYAKANSDKIYEKYKPVQEKVQNMKKELEDKYIKRPTQVDDYTPEVRDSFMLRKATAKLLLDPQGHMAMEAIAMGKVSQEQVVQNVRAALDKRHFFDKGVLGMEAAVNDPDFMKQLKKDLLKKQGITKRAPAPKISRKAPQTIHM